MRQATGWFGLNELSDHIQQRVGPGRTDLRGHPLTGRAKLFVVGRPSVRLISPFGPPLTSSGSSSSWPSAPQKQTARHRTSSAPRATYSHSKGNEVEDLGSLSCGLTVPDNLGVVQHHRFRVVGHRQSLYLVLAGRQLHGSLLNLRHVIHLRGVVQRSPDDLTER